MQLRALLILIVVACGLGRPAQATNVDLQLVLAIDTTASVSHGRFELQRDGYAAAFRNPQVIKAILSGAEQSIAVTMMQWNGRFVQEQVVPWTLVKDEALAHS